MRTDTNLATVPSARAADVNARDDTVTGSPASTMSGMENIV
jgi:hypothetical protein